MFQAQQIIAYWQRCLLANLKSGLGLISTNLSVQREYLGSCIIPTLNPITRYPLVCMSKKSIEKSTEVTFSVWASTPMDFSYFMVRAFKKFSRFGGMLYMFVKRFQKVKKCLFIKRTQYNDWHIVSSQWTFVNAVDESFLVVNFTTPKNYIIPGTIRRRMGRMEVP